MSSRDLLFLKWNNHNSTFQSVLANIHNKFQYEDATVACDGHFYPVHRLVLSACSEYFEEMFSLTNGKHPVIVLKDISKEVFETLLKYMYVGEVEVKKELLSAVIDSAVVLQIKGLVETNSKNVSTTDNSDDKEGKSECLSKRSHDQEELSDCPKKLKMNNSSSCFTDSQNSSVNMSVVCKKEDKHLQGVSSEYQSTPIAGSSALHTSLEESDGFLSNESDLNPGLSDFDTSAAATNYDEVLVKEEMFENLPTACTRAIDSIKRRPNIGAWTTGPPIPLFPNNTRTESIFCEPKLVPTTPEPTRTTTNFFAHKQTPTSSHFIEHEPIVTTRNAIEHDQTRNFIAPEWALTAANFIAAAACPLPEELRKEHVASTSHAHLVEAMMPPYSITEGLEIEHISHGFETAKSAKDWRKATRTLVRCFTPPPMGNRLCGQQRTDLIVFITDFINAYFDPAITDKMIRELVRQKYKDDNKKIRITTDPLDNTLDD